MGIFKKSPERKVEEDLEAGPPNEAQDPDEVCALDAFLEQSEEIKANTQTIRQKTESLSRLHAQTLESINPEEKASLSKQTEQMMEEITVVSNKNRALLKGISNDNKRIGSIVGATYPSFKMRSNQFSALSHDFMSALTQSQAAQQAFKNKYRLQLQRQYKVVNPNATEAELNKLVDSEGGSMMADQLFSMDDRRIEAKRALEEMQERHQDIMNIEKSILELNQLFVEMSTLVDQQGELVNQIHKHVEIAVDYTEKAQTQMSKAVKSQKSRIKKMYFLVIILLLLAIGGGVAIYFGIMYKKRLTAEKQAAET